MLNFKYGKTQYQVTKTDELIDAENLKSELIKHQKEPRFYFAKKVLKSGKLSKQGGMFYRFISGEFVKVG